MPSTAKIDTRPLSAWNGWQGGAVFRTDGQVLAVGETGGSGPVGTPTVATVQKGVEIRSIRLTESSSPSPRPMLDTTASVPAALWGQCDAGRNVSQSAGKRSKAAQRFRDVPAPFPPSRQQECCLVKSSYGLLQLCETFWTCSRHWPRQRRSSPQAENALLLPPTSLITMRGITPGRRLRKSPAG